jgi:hypothetical protein
MGHHATMQKGIGLSSPGGADRRGYNSEQHRINMEALVDVTKVPSKQFRKSNVSGETNV